MNPVNATALYVSACRSLLQWDPQDPEKYGGLFNVLTFFRDSLSCLACGNLLQDPIAPPNSSCQHYVCKGCKGKKMLLKPSCSWCKDYEQFEENKQLQILVDCYRNLCEYISVCVTTEPSASGVKGYSEVKKMLEEALEVKEEQEQVSICDFLSPVKDTLETSAFKDTHLTGSDQIVDKPPLKTELQPLSSTELNKDTVTVPNSSSSQTSGAKRLSHRNACDLESPESDVDSKNRTGAQLHKSYVSCGQTKTAAEARQQSPESQASSALAPDHPQQPQTGMSCLATSHRKVRLSRKRSRSESDSEMLQPLPIASLVQGPFVAATASPKAACEPKAPSPPAVAVANGGILKVNKAMMDLSKNIQVNTDPGNKKVQSKSKVATPKSKGKMKDRVLPAGMLPGQPTKVVYKKTQEKKGCKCGRATQNPSVLTCRGQRCPCYSNRKACLDCICRGCQNSYMANGEKKLEAFAVPEKALEQTRLTLGINLTSISVRNPGSNPGVLSLSAGSPMASFLASGADEDQNFEDALEMHFDC